MNSAFSKIEKSNEKTIMQKYGFALFDNEIYTQNNLKSNNMPCIVAVDGKITKYRKINELPKDIVYWTNLDKEYVWKYSRFAHLKDANYLGLSYESIRQNYFAYQDSPESVAKECAKLFSLVMNTLEQIIGAPNDPIEETIYQKYLTKSFRTKTPQAIRGVFEYAYKEKNSILSNPLGVPYNALILEANQYIDNLFDAPIPVGEWEEITDAVLKLSPAKQIEYLLEQAKDKSILVGVINTKLKETLTIGINEGALYLGNKGMLISNTVVEGIWLTEHDLELHHQYCNFTIEKVLINSDKRSFKKFFYSKIFTQEEWIKDNLAYISLCEQIISRLFIRSMMCVTHTREGKTPFTENMIWLQSLDKKLLLPHVFSLAKMGAIILNYGIGEIQIGTRLPKDITPIIKHLYQHNWIVPFDFAKPIPQENVMVPYVNESLKGKSIAEQTNFSTPEWQEAVSQWVRENASKIDASFKVLFQNKGGANYATYVSSFAYATRETFNELNILFNSLKFNQADKENKYNQWVIEQIVMLSQKG